MHLASFIRVLCIGATLWSASAQVQGRDRDQDDENENNKVDRGRVYLCWTCEQTRGCFECLSKSDNGDGTSTVKLDFSECKNRGVDSIGWACCTGSSGADRVFNEGDCEVPDAGCFGNNNRARDPQAGSPKCNRVSTMFVMVPSDATSVDMNTYDRFIGNDASPLVGVHPICAGLVNRGGPCAKRNNGLTSYCLETIDLSSCPTMGTLPSPTAAPTASATETIDVTTAPTTSPSVVDVSSISPTASTTETDDDDDDDSDTSVPSSGSLSIALTTDRIMSDLPTTASGTMSDMPSLVPTLDLDAASDSSSSTMMIMSDPLSGLPAPDIDSQSKCS